VVLSSPSGAGKTTIAERLLALRGDLGRSISATTRSPRGVEQQGRDYHFLSREEFERREREGEFLESASYGGQRYGTLRAEVDRLTQASRHALLVIEVAGARQVRSRWPGAVLVFVLPPSGPALVQRLTGRNTEDRDAVQRRLRTAEQELQAVGEYDFVLVNDDLERAVRDVSAILDGRDDVGMRRHVAAQHAQRLRSELAAAMR
jgi:guanylate kinase